MYAISFNEGHHIVQRNQMRSQSQLQRILLDAACILSSAANIARRAAFTIDVTQEGQFSKSTKPTHTSPYDQTDKRSDESYNAQRQNFKPRPWPSAVMGTLASPIPSAREEESTSRDGGNMKKVTVNDSLIHDAHSPERAEATLNRITPEKHNSNDSVKVPEPSQQQNKKDAADPGRGTSIESQTIFPSVESDPLPHTSSTTTQTTEEFLPDEYDATKENKLSPLRSSKVPSSRIARLMHYGSLGAGLAWGAAGSYIRGESIGGEGKQFMSDDNVRRLVDKLSTMRGAALKLGQFMSIQDSNLLPEQIEQVMLRVQNSAHYMPQWQMEKVMRQDLGENWRDGFEEFEDVPFASASIGQVHSAVLSRKSSSPLAGQKVAVKVQFPGVRESISSDLSNLRWLVTASAILPKGLFLDNTIRVMKRELDDECNYEREREMCKRFGDLLNSPESSFSVPRVVDDLCSGRVLTTEMMRGRPLTQAARFTQEKRDVIARSILELSVKELFSFRLMQTDPNWTNFLYNERTGKIELIDFGATREYNKAFMDDWLSMLRAAISGDRKECIRWSEKVGYLTGEESEGMQNAHVDSMIALGEPFRPDAPNPYPFAGQTITDRVRAQIPLMLRERLTPPPEPTYSLNRKLSGAFLLCARLKAKVDCKELFQSVTKDYVLGPISASHTSTTPKGSLANPTRLFQASQARPFSTSAFLQSSTRHQREHSHWI
jgi:predicted unusual protein kinase regulating ubiquinone biosynthesis (AarF/ABC1/UbiB family)